MIEICKFNKSAFLASFAFITFVLSSWPANATCAWTTITNGSTADAVQVMNNLDCLAPKSSPTFSGIATFGGTDALVVPGGTTAQRPTATNGMLRYNSSTPGIEAYYNSTWNSLGGGGGGGSSQWTTTGSDIYYNTGNVAIGTSSPVSSAALTLYSNTNWSGGWNGNLRLASTYYPAIRFFASNANKTAMIGNNNDGGLYIAVNGSGDAFGGYGLVVSPGQQVCIHCASPSYALHVDGTAYASGAAGALSDIRHKDNVLSLPEGILTKVMQLRPVTFTWKRVADDGMKGQQVGFIAQEVERIFPTIVLTEKNSEKTKNLKYNEFIPLLAKAIQEQQKQIAALQQKIAILEKR